MPQSLAIAGVERKHIAGTVAGDSEPGVGGHDARTGASSEFVDPIDFAGLVIDGFDLALAPYVVVRARPAIAAIGGLGEIDTPTGVRVHNKLPGLGIEAGCPVVRQSTFIR